MESGGGDDGGMLLVEKEMWKEEEVQKFVKEGGFVKVGEGETYFLFQLAEEEFDYEEDWRLISELGVVAQGPPYYSFELRSESNMKVGKWELSGDKKMEDVGIQELLLRVQVFTLTSVGTHPLNLWKDDAIEGDQRMVKKVKLSLGAVDVHLKNAASVDDTSTCRVVHQIDIELRPAGAWGVGSVEVGPNATDTVRYLTMGRSRGASATLSAAASPSLQVGVSGSSDVSQMVKQHGWKAQAHVESKAATWTWSLSCYKDGRPFNLAKTDRIALRAKKKSSQDFVHHVERTLVGESFQLSGLNDDVMATWTVDTAQLNGVDQLHFTVDTTLHVTAYRLVSVFKGCFRISRESKDPQLVIAKYQGPLIAGFGKS